MASIRIDVMQELLCELGLERKEAAIFITCLTERRCTPTSISRKTGIRRSTVYFHLERLERRGLIHYQIYGKKRFVCADDLRKCLELLTNEKKKKLDRALTCAAELVERLQQSERSELKAPRIEHFSGAQYIPRLLERLLHMQKDIYWVGDLQMLFRFCSPETFYKLFTLERMKNRTTTYAITDRRILNDKRFSEIIGNFRQFRFTENEIGMSGLLGIAGDCILFGSCHAEKPEMIIIEDKNMKDAILFLFENLWKRMAK